MASIQALMFDTGGTILDWYTGISTKLSKLGVKRNIKADCFSTDGEDIWWELVLFVSIHPRVIEMSRLT